VFEEPIMGTVSEHENVVRFIEVVPTKSAPAFGD